MALYPFANALAAWVDQVGFEPTPGARLPLDATFSDEHARAVRLGDYFAATPAIVVPAYYGCSNLCGIVLHALATSLARSRLRAGRDVEVIVVSIAPFETPALALRKKDELFNDDAADTRRTGWHFLTGSAPAVDRFARALGYRYAWDDAGQQYAHASGIVVAAVDGHIVRTLYGVDFPAHALETVVAAAADASTRTTPIIDRVGSRSSSSGGAATWLLCFHYDPITGRYSFVAMNAVRLASLAALLALGIFVVRARVRERASIRHAAVDKAPP
ncbi:MAG TPA: SCO family protein [Casimicrobiaceae bacterium]|nr:SCO family protein [Casimicrobiaceae bacterium]